jgi:pimeloyl-ACP methyl ester carboxylesterase
LAARFRVVCPDMRGFGWTDAPAAGYEKEELAEDLLGVCDALGIEQFNLGGHDWGGFVAFLTALRAPDRVRRLVLMNTGHGFLKVDWRLVATQVGFWYMPIIGMPGLGPALVRRGWLPRVVVRWGHPGGPPWQPDEWETYLVRLREPARARASQQLYGLFVTREFREAIAGRWKQHRLTVPTLFLHGAADRVIRPDFLRGWEDYADDFHLEFLDGVGHFLVDQEPSVIAARLSEFVDG